MPKPQRLYDKNRAPKVQGQPTVVYFHVTVLSLDSVNEESMVFFLFFFSNLHKTFHFSLFQVKFIVDGFSNR